MDTYTMYKFIVAAVFLPAFLSADELLDVCGQANKYITSKTVLKQSKSSEEQVTDCKVTYTTWSKLAIRWKTFDVGLLGFDCKPACKTFIRRGLDGLNVLDSDGTSFFSPLPYYAGRLNFSQVYNSREDCVHMGEDADKCEITYNYYPIGYGKLHDFQTSGQTVTFSFNGKPQLDKFEVELVPFREPDGDYCSGTYCKTGQGVCDTGTTGCSCAYTHTGPSCSTPRDVCATYLPCDSDRATCNSAMCTCKQGFEKKTGYQQFCFNIDECESKPCNSLANCKNTEGSYTCTCLPGYEGDGHTCTRIKPCTPNPCEHGGTCTPTVDNQDIPVPKCTCPPSHIGLTCTAINPCYSGPCQNGGTCLLAPHGFTCLCLDGFKGTVCTEPRNPNTVGSDSSAVSAHSFLSLWIPSALLLTKVTFM